MPEIAGANSAVFDAMVRTTIGRYLNNKERDELLDILAFIIRMERTKSAERE